MLIATILMIIFEITNCALGLFLYEETKNEEYFENVRKVEIPKNRYIYPEPRYILFSSIMTGLLLGTYEALASYYAVYKPLKFIAIGFIAIAYLAEITRKITIEDNQMVLSKLFFLKKTIPVDEIKGIYVHSYNKKFLKQHALTTKLVITQRNHKRYKFTISSLSNKKVFNMLKDNFGVINNKLYFQKNK